MAGADNWTHKSANMLCATCQYFVAKGLATQAGPGSDLTLLGRCRRHAPTMSGFPAVFADDWCGDHKLASPDLSVGKLVMTEKPSPVEGLDKARREAGF